MRLVFSVSGLALLPSLDGLVSGLLGGIRQKFCVDADLGCGKDERT
jgi:hypothetical protein